MPRRPKTDNNWFCLRIRTMRAPNAAAATIVFVRDLLRPSLKQPKADNNNNNKKCSAGRASVSFLASRFAFGGEPSKNIYADIVCVFFLYSSLSSSLLYRFVVFFFVVFISPVGPACYLCVRWRKLPAGTFWLFGRSDDFSCVCSKTPGFSSRFTSRSFFYVIIFNC